MQFFVLVLFGLLVSIGSFTNAVADYDKTLSTLKEQEKAATEWIRSGEGELAYLEERKKYWERQLTGPRRFFYPKYTWIRDMVGGWIVDYDIQIRKKRPELEQMRHLKQELSDQIYKIETQVREPSGAVDQPKPSKRFYQPKYGGGLLDNCLYFARSCGGRDAAVKFCSSHGFTSAVNWNLNYKNLGRTVVIGEKETVNGRRNAKRICSPKGGSGTTASPTGTCVSFEYITCR